MDNISPRYKLSPAEKVNEVLWNEYGSYDRVLAYIEQWHEIEDYWENFFIEFKDKDRKQISLYSTLCNMPGELLLKVAIDMGVETPDYIPSIPTFRNKIKENYKNASQTFEKAFREVEKDPSLAIGLANSVLESILKDILRANQASDYSEHDTLTELVRKCFKHFKKNDSSLPSEIKSIANSIFNAAKSIEDIRSDKTSFHGKSSECEVISQPEYAYFVINAVTTIGLFFLKYQPKQQQAIIQNFDDDLPF